MPEVLTAVLGVLTGYVILGIGTACAIIPKPPSNGMLLWSGQSPRHYRRTTAMTLPNLHQIYVPVRTDGYLIRDSSGDIIASCINPVIAAGIAAAINKERQP